VTGTILLLAALAFQAAPAQGKEVELEAGRLTVVLKSQPLSLSYIDRSEGVVLAHLEGGTGPLSFEDAAGRYGATGVTSVAGSRGKVRANLETDDPLGRTIELELRAIGSGRIALEAKPSDPRGITHTFASFAGPGGPFYGFGERSTTVTHTEGEVENYVSDGPFPEEDRAIAGAITPPWGARDRDDATYYPVPWILSAQGAGVLIDRDETSRFDLGDAGPAWELSVDAAELDLQVFAGPEPADALRRFTAARGRQPRPAAPWSFGPWFQTGQPNVIPLEEEAEIIRTLREGDAPVSAAETQMHYLPCGAQRGREEYIEARREQFHAAGLAHLGYFNPQLCVSYTEVFSEAAPAGILQREKGADSPFTYPAFVGGEGPAGFTREPLAQFDFTHPDAEGYYAGLIQEAYDAGYDGWMEDFGEYTPPFTEPADGTQPEQMHNRYPRDYHCAVRRIVKRLERPLSRHQRSGWTGAARCADIVWGGDPTTRWGFDGLSSAITQGMTIGLSGVARWGTDIGGYFSFGADVPPAPGLEQPKLTPEMLIRWIQVGALAPVMRTKRSGIAIPSYERPQVFDDEILPYWRRYTKLHTQLYPYLRAADAEYRRTGMPIMRHGILTHPDDADLTTADSQYMFGPALLAAPVVAPDQRKQSIKLPPGRWIDFWRSVRFVRRSGAYRPGKPRLLRGDREVTVPAPLGQAPLAIRAGSVLPLLPAGVDTLAKYGGGPGSDITRLADTDGRLIMLAFPRGRSRGTFYERGRLRSVEAPRGGRWKLAVRSDRRRELALRATLGTLKRPFTPRRVQLEGRTLPHSKWRWNSRRDLLKLEIEAKRAKLVVTGARG
jgi:sulfoquinovosidase